MQDKDLQKALNYSYFYLNFRPRSKREMVDYLTKKAVRFGWTKEVIDTALASLTDENLINDEKFIEWYVLQKSARKPKSAFILTQELARFGVDRQLVENFFMENNLDEEEGAKKALSSKWDRLMKLDKKERFKKSAAFLQRRGFSYDIVKKIVAEFESSSVIPSISEESRLDT